MSDEVVVRTVGLRKSYGSRVALDGVDLEVRRGEVFGFLGPNGAGKSTLIRILLDLLRPSAGRVEVLGRAPAAGGPALRARMGYLPGELTMTERTTARVLLTHLVALRDGRGADAVEPLAQRLGLDLDRPVRSLSKGTKQKVGLVQAFAHAPELLVLDEPTSGLDPLVQNEFRAMVGEARERGATVLLSSHVLGEVQDVADRVSVLRAGKVVDTDDVAALRHRAGQRVEVELDGPVPRADLAAVPGLSDVVVDGRTVRGLLRGEPGPLIAALTRHHVVRFSVTDRDLEELFLDLYREEVRS